MRTRIFNKMTTPEVEAYLARGGDTMFIAVGVVECHGHMPIDCETIGPEAYCKLLAEKADGLAMINLPYFYPGATVISNATVHYTISDGIAYLKKICHSLVDQGFKRLFLVNGHAPAQITINAFCREFFEETLIHPCSLQQIGGNVFESMPKIDPKTGPTPEQLAFFEKFSAKGYGAYKIMGQMDYLPVDPNWDDTKPVRMPIDPAMSEFSAVYKTFGGYTCQVYSDPLQHGGGRIFKSEEERLRICTIGEEAMREDVENCKIIELKEKLGAYQDYVQRMYQKFPRIKTKP